MTQAAATATGAGDSSNTWLAFAMISVLFWGSYGLLLHFGRHGMGKGPDGLFKAYFFVGIAYFLVAVLAPALMLLLRRSDWSFPGSGMGFSLLAGTAGAIGAFGVLLAFGAKGPPSVVMSIIFAGAPIINAVVSLTVLGGWGGVRWPFMLGILLAATGGALVTLFKPAPPPAAHKEPAPSAETESVPASTLD